MNCYGCRKRVIWSDRINRSNHKKIQKLQRQKIKMAAEALEFNAEKTRVFSSQKYTGFIPGKTSTNSIALFHGN